MHYHMPSIHQDIRNIMIPKFHVYLLSMTSIIYQLAPFALDAFPEAYPQFKLALMALLYDMGDQSSPVVSEWY